MSVIDTPPRRSLWAERVAYANGMLLDRADFEAEQEYHRGRLSMALRYLMGTGTVAGLNVAADPADPRGIVISPGLGIDRAGRIIQSPLALCLNLDDWYADIAGADPVAARDAFHAGSGGTADHILADVFIGFRDCPTAKRPAFESGDFDALGAVAPLRLRDAVEATLVLRPEADPATPDPMIPDAGNGSLANRRAALDALKREQGWLENAWWDDFDSALVPDVEHPSSDLAADLFLARLRIPATDGTPPELQTDTPPEIDNSARRMVYSTADLMALAK